MTKKKKRLSGIKLKERDNSIIQDRLDGATYKELSEKHNIKIANLSRILNKTEVKDLLDTGMQQIVALTPLAVKVHYDTMIDKDNPTLALKAAETILKAGSVLPGATNNKFIQNIYTQQNNYVTPDTMKLIRQILPGFKE